MIPFSIHGEPYSSVMIRNWENTNEIVECLANPYGNFKNGDPVYDCFGNCYIERDDLGRFAFSLSGNEKMVKRKLQAGNFSFSFECFSEKRIDNKYLNTLEVCGIPYAYTHVLYDYYNSNRNPNFAKTTLKNIIKLFPNNHTFQSPRPKCSKTDFSLYDPTQHERMAIKVSVSYEQIQHNIWRLIPYSFVHSGVGLPFPFFWDGQIWSNTSKSFQPETPEERNDRLLAYPYSYMDPLFTSKKFDNGTLDKSAISSFGMHDCFGNPLDEFDDCGGLPFWLIENRILRKPRKITWAGYNCWESFIPDYTCGGPSNAPRLIKHICDTWSKYISSPR